MKKETKQKTAACDNFLFHLVFMIKQGSASVFTLHVSALPYRDHMKIQSLNSVRIHKPQGSNNTSFAEV